MVLAASLPPLFFWYSALGAVLGLAAGRLVRGRFAFWWSFLGGVLAWAAVWTILVVRG
jgi:hypothetical protein